MNLPRLSPLVVEPMVRAALLKIWGLLAILPAMRWCRRITARPCCSACASRASSPGWMWPKWRFVWSIRKSHSNVWRGTVSLLKGRMLPAFPARRARSWRGAHGAEFPRPSVRHCHSHRRLGAGGPRHQGLHRLHAQDDTWAARLAEICRQGRRRHEPPFRAL